MKSLIIGGFYATPKNGGYGISRVLYYDEHSVHLSIYSNVYNEIPEQVNREELTFSALSVTREADGTITTAPYEAEAARENSITGTLRAAAEADSIGIMHFPLALEGFLKDEPILVDVQEFEPEDLEGFAYYLEAMGLSEEEFNGVLFQVMIRSFENAEEYSKNTNRS